SPSWDMKLAERPMIPRVLLLLVTLWMLLVPGRCSQDRPSWRYISSEVVIPKKEVHRGKGLQVSGRLSYSLRFRGQRHVIHLQRKTLLWPRQLLLMTQDDQGVLQMDYPFIPSDCYYLGHLEGIPQSMVTVDTCFGGLKGIMKLDDLAFEIKPLKNSPRFEHLVSQIVTDVNAVKTTQTLGRKEMSSKDYASHAGAMKSQVQAVLEVYKMSNNLTACTRYMLEIFSLVDTFWQSLHVQFYIFILTIYNVVQPFDVSYDVPGGASHTYYVTNFFNKLRPDVSVLVDKSGPQDDASYPVSGSMCGSDGLVTVGILHRNVLGVAIAATRRLALSVGLEYDNPEYCICQRRATCIMYPYPILTDAFSNCSLVKLQQIVSVPDDLACIFHQNFVYLNKSITHVRCGNGIVEEAEECDCGSFKFCYANECCESDCKLTADSICDKGTCCANCTYTPAGTLCRTIENICDLPEYCDGRSITCPKDIYLQDGTPCTEDGYCFRGNCTDRNMHCKEIFGANAHDAAKVCYSINKERYRFGHCSREETSLRYKACTSADMFCGRLQCTNVTHLPRLQDHVSFHQSVLFGVPCFGLDEHRASGTTDAGKVKSGALCASGRFCDRGSCNGSVFKLKYDCTPEKCNFRGTCNSNRNCHCHVGWNPPQCVGEGPGGSIDSGPLPRTFRSVRQSRQTVAYLRMIFARIYTFVASLLFGFASRIKILRLVKTGKK
uniref:Uncharacterized protein n=1 Tax=Nannospalax galili TaxID=1026970 RepID=A0A8C6RN52_NANGA